MRRSSPPLHADCITSSHLSPSLTPSSRATPPVRDELGVFDWVADAEFLSQLDVTREPATRGATPAAEPPESPQDWIVSSDHLEAVVFSASAIVDVLASDAVLLGSNHGDSAAAQAHDDLRHAALRQHLDLHMGLLQQLQEVASTRQPIRSSSSSSATGPRLEELKLGMQSRLVACAAPELSGHEVVARLVGTITDYIGAASSMLFEVDDVDDCLVVRVSDRATGLRVSRAGLAGTCANDGTSVLIPDTITDSRYTAADKLIGGKTRTVLYTPVWATLQNPQWEPPSVAGTKPGDVPMAKYIEVVVAVLRVADKL